MLVKTYEGIVLIQPKDWDRQFENRCSQAVGPSVAPFLFSVCKFISAGIERLQCNVAVLFLKAPYVKGVSNG